MINMSTSESRVGPDSRYDVIQVTGDYNSFYGSAEGRSVTVNSSTGNAIFASAGDNTYVGDGQENVLEYISPYYSGLPDPGAVNVNLATGVADNGLGGTDQISGINWVEAMSGSTLVGGSGDDRLAVLGNGGTIKTVLGMIS